MANKALLGPQQSARAHLLQNLLQNQPYLPSKTPLQKGSYLPDSFPNRALLKVLSSVVLKRLRNLLPQCPHPNLLVTPMKCA